MVTDFARWKRFTMALVMATLMVVSTVGAKEGDEEKGSGRDGPGPLAGATDQTTYGWILVPTADGTRAFSPSAARGITHFYVPATPNAQFVLDTTDVNGVRSCSLGICVQTGDFDIVYFHAREDGSTEVTARYTGSGAESGFVPPGSSFGLVYLKVPATTIKSKGFEFAYTERVV